MFVYVISAGSQACKVGITNSMGSRLSALQTGNHVRLTLEFAANVERAEEVERLAHQTMQNLRLAGEWFDATVDIAIATVKAAIRKAHQDTPDPLWEAYNGWDFAVGERVFCRLPGEPEFPGPSPVVGEIYTVVRVTERGTVELEELPNEFLTHCPSLFWPAA